MGRLTVWASFVFVLALGVSAAQAAPQIDIAGTTWAANSVTVKITGLQQGQKVKICVLRFDPFQGIGSVTSNAADAMGNVTETFAPLQGKTFQAGDVIVFVIFGIGGKPVDSAELKAGGTVKRVEAQGCECVACNATVMGVKVMIVKPGQLFKFVAKGTFPLPDPSTDDPTTGGGSLEFAGGTGGQTYALAANGWQALSAGFKFRGDPCKVVIVKEHVIKGVCQPDTGDFGPLPEAGAVTLSLSLGSGATPYCASCGGAARGNPDRIFKRKDCEAGLPPCFGSPNGAFVEGPDLGETAWGAQR
jgi:hypothetical protein